jgi:hypothetical protein
MTGNSIYEAFGVRVCLSDCTVDRLLVRIIEEDQDRTGAAESDCAAVRESSPGHPDARATGGPVASGRDIIVARQDPLFGSRCGEMPRRGFADLARALALPEKGRSRNEAQSEFRRGSSSLAGRSWLPANRA